MVIMFVTMVDHTTENATQYLTMESTRPPVKLGDSNHKFGDTDTDLMEFLGVDHL
jgi:hypothetical protein